MIDYPELRSEHVQGAKLFANRYDLIQSLSLPTLPTIAEIGVALGEFSKFLLEHFHPREFHAFDLFQVHTEAVIWGRPPEEVFQGKTHREYYQDAMAGYSVKIYEGLSENTLQQLPDACLDLAYIDAQHSIEGVTYDTEQSVRALKRNGIIVFNDYIAYDPFQKSEYGVIPVVNRLIVEDNWRVLGFGLQHDMFCDIAVTRAGP